ncbi:ski oncogene-like [Watersipora subatra]|uniref:ski oncogene-like n=1 Tax=Watersipora subatra TaxID=2589382 RepID=UPI00355BF1CC
MRLAARKLRMDDTSTQKLEELFAIHQQLAMNSLAGPASVWRNGGTKPPTNGHRFPTLLGDQMSKTLLSPTDKISSNISMPFNYKRPLFGFPVVPPLMLQPDTDSSELIFCELENYKIAGFLVGGEERLCVPPILHSVLKDIELSVIDAAFDALLIHCSRCTAHQLKMLKQERILSAEVPQAGLIRKTDAERLCTSLLHSKPSERVDPDQRKVPQFSPTCVPVYHECFGEGHGFFYTDSYTHDSAQCISCADCEKLFSPERFVTHSHYNQENNICHWGFNRRNWRNYLLLSEDELEDEDVQTLSTAYKEILEKYKNNSRKRKPEEGQDGGSTDTRQLFSYNAVVSSASHSPNPKRRCNRPPMRAYQYVMASPSIENPDLVVSNSDADLYEKNYVPNICLKPTPTVPDVKADNAQEEQMSSPSVEALDLRSPTQRQNSSLSTAAEEEKVEGQSESGLEEQDDGAEEILDVESDGDPDPAIADKDVPVQARLADYTMKLESMFLDVLVLSSLSEIERESKRGQFNEYLKELRLSLKED